jgi:putative DNA primase/helicase
VLAAAERWLGSEPPASPRPRKPKGPALDTLGPATGKWDYWSAEGQLLACVYRYDPPTGKEFRPRDVVRGRDGAPPVRPLYNLPGILHSHFVVVVEGEKCAQALIDLGLCATTLMGGANTPVDKCDLSPLAGKTVLIWPDRDEPGARYAERVAQAVLAAGALSCALLQPPEDKPKKWDAADAVAEGFDVRDFVTHGPRTVVLAETLPESPAGPEPQERTVWGSEDDLAMHFTRRFGEDWRYVAQWGQWLVWTGNRWQTDQTLCAQHLIRQVCRDAALRADSPRTATKLASSGAMAGVERMARTDRRHAALAEEWDADPWRLNTPGGVVDLRTGEIHAHHREDRMTRLATATPRGDCPTWRRFLDTVTRGDADLQAYLARMAGYALTGSTREHALFFLHGTGSNGKSVFLNTLTGILGDYANSAPMDTFLETRSDRHPTDMAGLRGARLVTAVETDQGRRWAEAKIKALTGGDKVSARFMRQDFFEYVPQFKLVIAGNHKPAIRNVDEAMKRRLHLVPFTVTIPLERRDPDLPRKLLAEADGILAWMVAGCLEWQCTGLKPPQCVVDATEEYFEEEDTIGEFLDEECQQSPLAREAISVLYQRWRERAERRGEYLGNSRWFSQQLINRGFARTRLHGGVKGLTGLSLKPREPGFLPYRDD